MTIAYAKQELERQLEELEKVAIDLTREGRNKAVEEITEAYFKQVGKYPDTSFLNRLTNVILIEDIKDKTPDKLQKRPYPYLTDRQILTRLKKEIYVEEDALNFLHQKEVKKMNSAFKKRTKNMED
jgi:hypothetical protein